MLFYIEGLAGINMSMYVPITKEIANDVHL